MLEPFPRLVDLSYSYLSGQTITVTVTERVKPCGKIMESVIQAKVERDSRTRDDLVFSILVTIVV